MDAGTILRAMGGIREDFVAEAMPKAGKVGRKAVKIHWIALAAAAACLLLLAGGALYAAGAFRPRTMEGLVAYRNRNHGPIAAGAYFITCVVENRAARYEKIYTLDSADLEPFVGDPYSDGIYRVRGMDNLKYLILESDEGELVAFEFR